MYQVFPNLPPINTNSLPSEIKKWKSDPIVAENYKKLFIINESDTFMSKIIDQLWSPKKTAPRIHIAYAMSICEFFLNPKNQNIQMKESSIKFKFATYLQKLENKKKISSSDEETTGMAAAAAGTATAPGTAMAAEVEEDNDNERGDQDEEDQGEENQNEGGQNEDDEGGQDDVVEVDEIIHDGGGYSDGDSYYTSEEERRISKELKRKYKK